MSNEDFARRIDQYGSGIYASRSHWQRVHIDVPLLVLLLILIGAGLFILYGASGQNFSYVERQGLFFIFGLLIMLVVAQMPPRFLRRWGAAPYIIGIGLLISVIAFGSGAKGAQRWLELGGLRFQPSEILKVAVPLMLASFLGSHDLPPSFRNVLFSLIIIGLPCLLVVLQPDLGTALLILASGTFVLLLAGLDKGYIISAGLLGLTGAPLAWFFLLHDYQKQRILTMFNPEADKLGAGWNIIQSTTAIGSGGFYGKGWLMGTQSQLNFLPESHTDFIIATLAEDFGFVGVMLLLSLYLLIVARCLMICLRARTAFSRLLGGSITLTFFVYVFVNMGMVSGLLPVVGVPLPMVSYGGTSIVTLMLGFGMLMAIATEKNIRS